MHFVFLFLKLSLSLCLCLYALTSAIIVCNHSISMTLALTV